jgi:hypothetical protein
MLQRCIRKLICKMEFCIRVKLEAKIESVLSFFMLNRSFRNGVQRKGLKFHITQANFEVRRKFWGWVLKTIRYISHHSPLPTPRQHDEDF